MASADDFFMHLSARLAIFSFVCVGFWPAAPRSLAAQVRAEVPLCEGLIRYGPSLLPYSKHRYRGIYRREVKTTAWPPGDQKALSAAYYTSVTDLLNTLPTDSAMHARHYYIRQSKGFLSWFRHLLPAYRKPLAHRLPEEQDNVAVTGYLYAIKKMNDRDYHLVLISSPDLRVPYRVMNVEISGLRKSSPDYPILYQARMQCLYLLGRKDVPRSWTILQEPLKIRVRGALFFDGKKERVSMKPSELKPVTAWEVHPIYCIEKVP
jgi:hypothetical protein